MGNYILIQKVSAASMEAANRGVGIFDHGDRFANVGPKTAAILPELSGANIRTRKISEGKNQRFSKTEIDLIRESWVFLVKSCEENKTFPGVVIFEKILNDCPAFKPLFDGENARYSFQRHGHVVTDLIDLAIRNIEELDGEVSPALIIYGRRHCSKYDITFTEPILNAIKMAVLSTLKERVKNLKVDAEIVWNRLLDFALEKLHYGNEIERNSRERSPKI